MVESWGKKCFKWGGKKAYSHFQQKDLIIHRLLKEEVRELSSLYFRAKSRSMKVRLVHFKSPPTATNANWASKWYYKSLRWDFSQNKTQQRQKETSRKQSWCFSHGSDSQQGTPGDVWRSVGLSPGVGDAGGSEMLLNILQSTETARSTEARNTDLWDYLQQGSSTSGI